MSASTSSTYVRYAQGEVQSICQFTAYFLTLTRRGGCDRTLRVPLALLRKWQRAWRGRLTLVLFNDKLSVAVYRLAAPVAVLTSSRQIIRVYLLPPWLPSISSLDSALDSSDREVKSKRPTFYVNFSTRLCSWHAAATEIQLREMDSRF